MILTPEIIEAGARAIHAECAWCTATRDWDSLSATAISDLHREALACLTASTPGVIEACAQAAIKAQISAAPAEFDWSSGFDAGIEYAIDAIRALSPRSTNQEKP